LNKFTNWPSWPGCGVFKSD